MTPDPFTDRLSDYLDDELSAGERASMDRHLAACAACRRTLDELREVVARAASLRDGLPAGDLWTGIAARIEQPESPLGFHRLLTFWKSPDGDGRRLLSARTVSLTLPQLAAASLTLMVLSGGLVWLARSGDPRADFAPIGAAPPPAIASAPEVRPANFSDAFYDDAISDLEQTLNEGRAKLDPETVRVLEENLNAIDRAIDQCRRALADDPANVYLNTHMAEARQRKLALLRRATALAASAGG
jgi:Putative zinc-finger